MTRATITTEEASEIEHLRLEYVQATVNAANALGRYSKDPEAPAICQREDARATAAIKRIREIYGD